MQHIFDFKMGKVAQGFGYMTFIHRNKGYDHLGAERVNCSKFLFLLFRLISKNIANWNKCKRIYRKECMSQIRTNNN